MSALRKFLKGYGANVRGEYRRRKSELLEKIRQMDFQGDVRGLNEEEWELRYKLEGELTELYKAEEIYWRGEEV